MEATDSTPTPVTPEAFFGVVATVGMLAAAAGTVGKAAKQKLVQEDPPVIPPAGRAAGFNQPLPFLATALLVVSPADDMTRAIGQVNDCLLIEYGVTLLDEQGLQIPASLGGWDMLGKTSAHGPRPCLQALARILLSIWNRAHNQGHNFLQAGGDRDNARDLFNRRIKRVFKKVSYSDPYAARADDGGYTVTFAGVRVLAYKITRIDNTTEKTKDSYYEFLGFRGDTQWPIAFAAIVYHACGAQGHTDEECLYMAVAKTIQCIGMSYGFHSAERFGEITPVTLGLPAVEFD
jgi:hypothetical protein